MPKADPSVLVEPITPLGRLVALQQRINETKPFPVVDPSSTRGMLVQLDLQNWITELVDLLVDDRIRDGLIG